MQRLTTIMDTYQLSWEDLRDCPDETEWKKRINDNLCNHFSKYCQHEATKYKHPLISWLEPMMQPRIRSCLRFGGELAIAALRIRAPRLRLRPYRTPAGRRDDNTCRYCGATHSEHGRHLIFCSSLPPELIRDREIIIDKILTESGLRRRITRSNHDEIEPHIIEFDWPHQSEETLKALLVFCRNLINQYARFDPGWERAQLAAYPVRRTRPRRSCSTPMEPVDPS